jgi:hypothetical protein
MAIPTVEDLQKQADTNERTPVAYYNPKTKRYLNATTGLRKYSAKLKLTPLYELPEELKGEKTQQEKNIEAALAKRAEKEAAEKAEAEAKAKAEAEAANAAAEAKKPQTRRAKAQASTGE